MVHYVGDGHFTPCRLMTRGRSTTSNWDNVTCRDCLASRLASLERANSHIVKEFRQATSKRETSNVKRYSITQIQRVINELTEWRDASQETLDNEEAKDYPNDERIDKLSTRIDALTEAIEALEGIE